MKIIAPSILSADFTRLGKEIKAVEEAGADWIHIDIMDGHFVPNITIGPGVVESIRAITGLPFDVHLMVEYPERYIDDFVRVGSNIITIHVEASYHPHRTIQSIKEKGVKAGISLNPATPVSMVEEIIRDVDLVLIMSVNPGFGGQTFIPSTLSKVERMRALIDEKGSSAILEVDGGIKVDNIASIAHAGADAFVSGSGIFGTKDYRETLRRMRAEIGEEVGVRSP